MKINRIIEFLETDTLIVNFSPKGLAEILGKPGAAGFLREKPLILEGHNIEKLRGNYVCNRNKYCLK